MQGNLDSTLYVQSTNEECYQDMLFKNMLIWIDDIFVYAENVEAYVVALENFFDQVAHFGFKLSPSKTKLYTHEVKWCGRIISGEGVKQDPERIQHLCAIPYPTNAGDLQQFVCAVNWLRDSMTEYEQTVDPLQQCLTKALEGKGKGKKKRIASGVHLELTDSEKKAFDAVKSKLRASRLVQRGHNWTKKRRPAKSKKATRPQQKLRPLDDDFVWPGVDDIRQGQEQYASERPPRTTNDGKLLERGVRLWIPSAADDLIQRIMVVAHCGSMVNRGHSALVASIKRLFYVDHLAERASEFLRGCLLCPHVKGGRVVHRPYAPPRWHAKEGNEGIHFDYLYMGEAYSGAKYVLVLKDDLTHYCELVACDGPTSQVCVDALVDWTKRFGMPRVWVSDQGTHIKNMRMKALAHRFKHSGTYESRHPPSHTRHATGLPVGREGMGLILLVVQSNLNQTPAVSLANKSPMELFTALNPAMPLDVVVVGVNKNLCEVKWQHKDIQKNLDELRTSLHAMHKEVLNRNEQRHRRLRGLQRDRRCYGQGWTSATTPSYSSPGSVQHLVTHEEREAHMSRVKMYAEASFEVTEEVLEHVSDQGIILEGQIHRGTQVCPGCERIHIGSVLGSFEDIESSWEPLKK
ncbi:hypothetical protein AaE_002421 [Aphanomyces astaci]|uniref:Reverse transcriptase domain-containing protein n=1 Tax=Aphanomyces astaci TaxID=112090 RepID=A0A6A5AUE0_APHAT|nr:hypothetical protein AaE_002421 [Aphanomyces astaci]